MAEGQIEGRRANTTWTMVWAKLPWKLRDPNDWVALSWLRPQTAIFWPSVTRLVQAPKTKGPYCRDWGSPKGIKCRRAQGQPDGQTYRQRDGPTDSTQKEKRIAYWTKLPGALRTPNNGARTVVVTGPWAATFWPSVTQALQDTRENGMRCRDFGARKGIECGRANEQTDGWADGQTDNTQRKHKVVDWARFPGVLRTPNKGVRTTLARVT